MEVGPGTSSPEVFIEPDLFEEFADQVVTIFGITGTFTELRGLCTQDLSDPSITQADTNEFIVKVANEGKLEIKKEHEEYFNKTLERLGLERKFTVSEKSTPPEQDKATERSEEKPKPRLESEQITEKVTTETVIETPHAATLLKRDAAIDPRLLDLGLNVKQVAGSEPQVRNSSKEGDVNVQSKPVIKKARPLIRQIISPSLSTKKPIATEKNLYVPPSTPENISKPLPQETRLTLPVTEKEQIAAAVIEPTSVGEITNVAKTDSRPKIEEPHEAESLSIASGEDLADGQILFFNNADTTAQEPDNEMYAPEIFNDYDWQLTLPEMDFLYDYGVEEVRLDEEIEPDLDGDIHVVDSAQAMGVNPVEKPAIAMEDDLPAPVERIEAVLTVITEALEEDESGRIEAIMSEIISLPEVIDSLAIEIDKDALIKEKLTELFVELFEEIGIEPSYELVESFIKLTQDHFFDEVLTSSKTEEFGLVLPVEAGTREFLQKLLKKLNDMKKTAVHFYKLGRSVLNLYNFRSLTAVSS